MRKRLAVLLAGTAVVFAACGPAASPSASAPAPAESTPPASEPAASASAAPATIDELLFGSDYAPATGTNGGTVVIADWQIPDQMNYYYSNAFVNTQVFAATSRRPLERLATTASGFRTSAATVPRVTNGMIRIGTAKGTCPAEAQQGDTPSFEVDLDIKPGLLWSDGETARSQRPEVHVGMDHRSGPDGSCRRHHRLGPDRQTSKSPATASRPRSTSAPASPACTACSARRSCRSTTCRLSRSPRPQSARIRLVRRAWTPRSPGRSSSPA